MTRDKITESLLASLKQALAEPGEHRLYRSGKLAGLFASRSGAAGDAASRALREGFVELTRTESKGRTTIEWVKLTPRGVNFVHEHESPVRVLQELRTMLRTSRDGVPIWLDQVRQDLKALEHRLNDEVQRLLNRLEALGLQVEQALHHSAEAAARVPDDLAASSPWAGEALAYLERRQASGATGACSLPELFAALREANGELSLTAFHDGLRRLHERKALRLLPLNGPASALAEPEFALLDGAAVLYFVER